MLLPWKLFNYDIVFFLAQNILSKLNKICRILGILCYEFLHGYPPFEGKDQEDTYRRIRMRDMHFADFIRSGAKDLISNVSILQMSLLHNPKYIFDFFQLIVIKSDKRMSLSQVMKHPWIIENK